MVWTRGLCLGELDDRGKFEDWREGNVHCTGVLRHEEGGKWRKRRRLSDFKRIPELAVKIIGVHHC